MCIHTYSRALRAWIRVVIEPLPLEPDVFLRVFCVLTLRMHLGMRVSVRASFIKAAQGTMRKRKSWTPSPNWGSTVPVRSIWFGVCVHLLFFCFTPQSGASSSRRCPLRASWSATSQKLNCRLNGNNMLNKMFVCTRATDCIVLMSRSTMLLHRSYL